MNEELLISAIAGLALFTAYLVRYMMLTLTTKLERIAEIQEKLIETLTLLCAKNDSEHRVQDETLQSVLKVLLRIYNGSDKKVGSEKGS